MAILQSWQSCTGTPIMAMIIMTRISESRVPGHSVTAATEAGNPPEARHWPAGCQSQWRHAMVTSPPAAWRPHRLRRGIAGRAAASAGGPPRPCSTPAGAAAQHRGGHGHGDSDSVIIDCGRGGHVAAAVGPRPPRQRPLRRAHRSAVSQLPKPSIRTYRN